MKQTIENHLLAKPSYFKWGASRLARKFNCSEKTIISIVKKLEPFRQSYLQSL